jgi:hypothetical protein
LSPHNTWQNLMIPTIFDKNLLYSTNILNKDFLPVNVREKTV